MKTLVITTLAVALMTLNNEAVSLAALCLLGFWGLGKLFIAAEDGGFFK